MNRAARIHARDVRYAPDRRPKANVAGGPGRAKSRREQMQRRAALFDHLVGESEQRSGNSKNGQ